MNLNINICGSSPQKNIGEYHLVNELKNIPQKKNKQTNKQRNRIPQKTKKKTKKKQKKQHKPNQTNKPKGCPVIFCEPMI